MAPFSEQQQAIKLKAQNFVLAHIIPYLSELEETKKIPNVVFSELRQAGFLGSLVTKNYGGLELDYPSYGLIHQEIGGASGAIRSLLTVHDMVCLAIQEYGTLAQKTEWLPQLTQGRTLAAFALSEENAGNQSSDITTHIQKKSHYLYLNGEKKWVSYAQMANLFLVFAKLENKTVALLVPSTLNGITINPINHLVATESAALGNIKFDEVKLTTDYIIGNVGLNLVVNRTLMLGRYSIAWGNVGILRQCYLESLKYSQNRIINQQTLFNHQLTQEKLTNMLTNFKAARLLGIAAGQSLQDNASTAVSNVMIAKYFSSKAAVQAVLDTIQLHGAVGFQRSKFFHQWLFDAKLSEIIEGSTEIHQINITQLCQSLEMIEG